MNNFRKRYERECCAHAEQLVEHICAMEKSRVELAYRRLVELLERAQRRRAEGKAIPRRA